MVTHLPPYFLEIFEDGLPSDINEIDGKNWKDVELVQNPNLTWFLVVPNSKPEKVWNAIILQAMHFLGGFEGGMDTRGKKQNSIFLFPAQDLPKQLLPFWTLRGKDKP